MSLPTVPPLSIGARCLLLTLALTASACGGATGSPGPGEDAGSDAVGAEIIVDDGGETGPDGTPPGPDALPEERCRGLLPHPVDSVRTLDHEGIERLFRVHVPEGYDPDAPTSVVLNFHGFTSDSTQQILLSDLNDKADAEGFIAVHADGTGVAKSWNAGLCCGEAASGKRDDVGFVRAMIDDLSRDLCVDAKRIYATGMSNGGFLSHRLACELSDRIAAVAPVAGVVGIPDCQPTRAVPVMHFHGTLDPLVPYDGGQPYNLPEFGGVLPTFPPVMDSFLGWAGRNGCDDEPAVTYQNGDVTCRTYALCRDGVETTLCTVEGGGHTWPGGFPVETIAPYLGRTSNDIVATDAMWTFFERHPLP